MMSPKKSPSPRLSKISLWVVRVPLLQEWASSPEFGEHGQSDQGVRMILRLTDADGVEGWGESASRGSSKDLKDRLRALLKSEWPFRRCGMVDLYRPNELYWQRPDPPSPYSPEPGNLRHRLRMPWQNLIETALCDLIAKRAGVSLSQLWGGPWRDSVQVDYWMGRTTPDHAVQCIKRAISLGFSGVKLKTTLEDPNVERLEAIRDTGGPDWKVTVDPNGRFYRLDDALPTILAMDQIGNMAALEDPFPRFHLAEFSELRARINARIVVHIDPPETIWSVITSGAAGGLNISHPAQGPLEWLTDSAVAERANLSIWHGGGLDLGIATASQIHLAASAPNCRLPGGQVGPWLRQSSLLKTQFMVENGKIHVPSDGHGLGVTMDMDALQRFTLEELHL